MRTIKTKVFFFNELSEEAKKTAITQFRNKGIETDFVYDDAYETVKKFHEVFNTSEGFKSWLDVYFINIDENILNFQGLRLRTYLINNFGHILYKRKFYKSIGYNRVINHPCIKTNFYDLKKGAICSSSNFYYSRITKENSCVLTGVCYDDTILSPIYEFIENYTQKKSYNDSLNFKELVEDCFYTLDKAIEEEIDYMNSDEGLSEFILSNDYEFTKYGKIFN